MDPAKSLSGAADAAMTKLETWIGGVRANRNIPATMLL